MGAQKGEVMNLGKVLDRLDEIKRDIEIIRGELSDDHKVHIWNDPDFILKREAEEEWR